MIEPIILVGQSGNAMCPYPCPIHIEKAQEFVDFGADGKPINRTVYRIVCNGDFIIAKYKEIAPAKMELARLREEWNCVASMRPSEFKFVKDVKEID